MMNCKDKKYKNSSSDCDSVRYKEKKIRKKKSYKSESESDKKIKCYKGDKGDPGECGERGECGEKGDRGERGLKGSQGVEGERGEKGEKGDKGDPGVDGKDGRKGDQGPIGYQGEEGCKGDKGNKGDKGDKGDIGERGIKGEKGERGPKGDKGERGCKGDTGLEGQKGERGEVGAKGEKGEKGDTCACIKNKHSCSNNKHCSTNEDSKVKNCDYVWVIKDDIETLSCVLKYQNIIFTSIREINGWAYNKRTGYFICNNSGKYLVSYCINISTINCTRKATIIGTINDDEIIGSTITSIFSSDHKLINNSFILNINDCDNFSLKIAGTSNNILITCMDAILTEKPVSASMTITRISNK